MKYYARIGDREYACDLQARNGLLEVTIEGRSYTADLQSIPGADSYSLLLDGRSYEFTLHDRGEAIELSGGAGRFEVRVEDARTHAARKATAGARERGGPAVVRAVMPGIVREVLVEVGEAVEKGRPLLILEAMKMQNEIRAGRAGLVARLHVAPGRTVEKGAPLVELA